MKNPDCKKCQFHLLAGGSLLCQNGKLIAKEPGVVATVIRHPVAFCAEFLPVTESK